MITRREMVNEIIIQLGYAKESNVVEQMKKKNIEEVERIADEFEFYEFNAWIEKYGYLNLEVKETPSEAEWILPLILWTWKSGVCDGRVFKYREDYRRILSNCGEFGQHIAQNMHDRFLFEIPLEELLGV